MSAGPAVRCAVRAGAYYDSIVLMQLQRALAALPGVLDAGVVMATPANRDLLAASGLLPGEPGEEAVAAGADDLLIAIQAESEAAAGEALARVDSLLAVRRAGAAGQEFRPRSLASAFKQLPEARWVLVSVPGRYAAAVADEALDSGRNVFLYSDNVSLADEVALKKKARDRGLLVLGPDCGTAIVGGTGLGFANRTRPGRIGLIGASGTGLQAVVSHLHARGAGISQAIGTGGRDLSAEVGGITAAQAFDLLARDPETEVIVLISKPPAPEVAHRLIGLAHAAGKRTVVYFPGAPLPGPRLGDVGFTSSLERAAEDALLCLTAPRPAPLAAPIAFAPGQRFLRGLFSGGTLALEVLRGLAPLLAPRGHAILDLGADEFTVGRLHPMIDFDLRLRRLRKEAADPEVALILLDVVLGDGAHADPAGELGPVIERVKAEAQAAGRILDVAVLVVGTDQDPQDANLQTATLKKAGAWVCRTVTDLLDYAVQRLGEIRGGPLKPEGPPVPLPAVHGPLAAVNVGLESFYDSLVAQGARAVHVEWKPPAGGNEKMAGILARMKRSR
ncbi:MAG TPA: acyl-CoA synthetase FdrA [Thermoanaerobaculia bacterium]|nr:acyl-CoA synthetase FdrA [Thermoanaerobaculia bacterium]